MKKPSQEDLLGYVLGALDADQQRDVQQVLDQDSQLEERLLVIKSSLQPLELLDEVPAARPGLARRTCEMLATIQKEEQLRKQSAEPALTMEPMASPLIDSETLAPATANRESKMSQRGTIVSRGGWSLNDVLVLAASLAVVAAVLFPAISYSRYYADIQSCQSNLASLGQAFLTYSDNHNGRFVQIPADGNLAVAGSFAPILKDAGLVDEDSLFACAGVKRPTPTVIPSCSQVEGSSGYQLTHLQRTMSGDYGYSLGYLENDRYLTPAKGQSALIILSDQPSNLEGHRSRNHRGVGQNCLFRDGHYEYVAGYAYGDDAIFLNDYHLVAPGTGPDDCVIGASFHSPSHFQLKAH